jgi:hypothetical protein
MLYWILSRRNQEKAEVFFEKYATGIDLSEKSPIRILRERHERYDQQELAEDTRQDGTLYQSLESFCTRSTCDLTGTCGPLRISQTPMTTVGGRFNKRVPVDIAVDDPTESRNEKRRRHPVRVQLMRERQIFRSLLFSRPRNN